MNPYRIIAVSAGWLVQRKKTVKEFIEYDEYETLAFCETLNEAVDYLFAWKEINT